MNTYVRPLLVIFLSALAFSVSNGVWAGTFATVAALDTTAPVLTTPVAQSITSSSALINWDSNKVADSRVYFGTAVPLIQVAGEIEYATSHTVKLTKLLPNTSYSFQVVSMDPMGNKATGSVQSFSTSGEAKTSQSIGAISFTPTTLAVGGTSTASATATSGLGVSFNSATPAICSVTGSIVTGVIPGICTVIADQVGDITYDAAAQVTQNITVTQGTQGIGAIGFNPATLKVAGTTAASATATSGLAVTFSSTTPTICSVSGSTVTGLLAGTCTVAANQAGNANYAAAAQVTQNITVTQGTQGIGAIGFNPATLKVAGTTAASATATSGLAVTFSSTTPTICSVSGSTVTGLLAGTCTVAANQAGNANYAAAAQVTQNITVTQGTQGIGAIGFNPATLKVAGTTAASATATSGLAVTFSSTTPTICSVSGSTVTGLLAGTCTVAANQAGNANYAAAAQVTQNITVTQGTQGIGAIGFNPATLKVAGTTAASATATSGLAVTFSSTTPTICSVSGSTVTGLLAGTCTVAANQAGNANYAAAAQVTQNITVTQGTQGIGAIGFNPATLKVAGTTAASATATSGLAVTFSSTTPTICSVSGSTVTGVAAGTCSITASQSGNSNFAAATPVSQNIGVGLVSQTIGVISFSPTGVSVGGTTTASATASSGLGVTFSSSTPTICSVSGSTVTALAVGTCTVAANQAGNANYSAAAQVTQNITVGQASQSIGAIAFNPTSMSVGGTSTASAAATSGLAVAFSSMTPTICSLSGNTITALSAGGCTVSANQAGNANYSAAPQVTANITVAPFNTLTHYYTNILNRAADDGGKAFWESEVSRMGRQGVSPNEAYIVMALYFFTSPEFLARGFTDDQFVRNLYLAFYNRAADAGGLDYWKGQLSAGLPRDMVMYAFMFSGEFNIFMIQNVGATNQRAEVVAVVDYYRGAFGRLPDDGGLKAWVNQFRTAQCSSDPTSSVYTAANSIAAAFFGGADYNNPAPSPNKYISDLYNAFMRRSADLGGYNYWVTQVSTAAQSRDQVRQQFIDSPEFAARVQAIAAQGCTTMMQ